MNLLEIIAVVRNAITETNPDIHRTGMLKFDYNDDLVTFAVLLEKEFDITVFPEDVENKTIEEISLNIYEGLREE